MTADTSTPNLGPNAVDVNAWLQRLGEPGERWWFERPERCTWAEFQRHTAGRTVQKLPALRAPDTLRPDDVVHPLVARAMLAPAMLAGDLVALPWTVLRGPQTYWTSPSVTRPWSSPALDMVLPVATDEAVHRLAERTLDDAGKVFNDPSFRFTEQDIPLNSNGHLPRSLGDSHRDPWLMMQHARVRRSFMNVAQAALARTEPPDDALVARWQRWAMVLGCTTYSQAEALVVQALVQYGRPVPLRMVTPLSVLRNVPNMPVGFFASVQDQGMDLSQCVGYYQQTTAGKWKSMTAQAVSQGGTFKSTRTLQFNLLDLAALRGRHDLVGWCLDQGLRPNHALADTLIGRLREDLHEASTARRAQAAQRLQSVEALFLRASMLPESGPDAEPGPGNGTVEAGTARRRL